MQGKKLKVKELQQGMVLMSDIYCPQTGVLLLKKGTVLRDALLGSLQKNKPEMYCHVYNNFFEEIELTESALASSGPSLFEEKGSNKADEEAAGFDNGDFESFPPDFVDQEAREIYVQACLTLDKIYSSRKIKPYLHELYSVIDYMVRKLLLHPEMMVYAALLKRSDNSTFCHAVNVSVYSVFLGRLIGLKEAILREIALAGMMHDIGKLDISAAIWNKKGLLTEWEFTKVKEHSLYSFFRLVNLEQVDRQSLVAVLQHHERLDGSGYPHGLKEDKLHLWSKILAITDVYDAYTSERAYRKAHSYHEGLEFLWQKSDQFDKKLLKTFIHNLSFLPIGCRVLLNTGESGIVMGIHKHIPHRPIIRVKEKDGIGEKLLDLAKDRFIFIEKLV